MSSKTTSTVSEGYKIENLTIAVVVNRKRLLASLGEGAGPEALDRQIKEVERLVGSAAGIDAKRGDRITIAAVDFLNSGQPPEPAAPAGMLEPLLQHTSSFVNAATILLVAMLLIWFGLRPATRALLEARTDVPEQNPQLPNASAAPGITQASAAGKVAREQQSPKAMLSGTA